MLNRCTNYGLNGEGRRWSCPFPRRGDSAAAFLSPHHLSFAFLQLTRGNSLATLALSVSVQSATSPVWSQPLSPTPLHRNTWACQASLELRKWLLETRNENNKAKPNNAVTLYMHLKDIKIFPTTGEELLSGFCLNSLPFLSLSSLSPPLL